MKRLNTEIRQKQIIETALSIIKEKGLSRLTIKNLSNAVQLSEQAIYRHFENKLAILKALIVYFNQSLHEKLNERPPTSDILQDIEQIIICHLEFFASKPEMASLVYTEEVFHAEPLISAKIQETIDKRMVTIAGIIKQAQQEGLVKQELDSGNLALMIFGTIRIVITNWRFSGFSFDLVSKGQSLAKDLIYLIQTKN
ncbi:MAG TPA: TetR family transcriptional regulator [Calditrichaeota bacterium]|nr:TetR family transcriptional regulator [Calditrichota bacterium]